MGIFLDSNVLIDARLPGILIFSANISVLTRVIIEVVDVMDLSDLFVAVIHDELLYHSINLKK
jgi:hypothetical protein